MIGQSFGNYRALSLLGEGGMGAVYLAEHPGIGRRVAIKVLHKALSLDPQILGRFLNEARTANAIRHPNIIEILDSGTTADGMPYLVMELLEGETLAARIRRPGRMPLRTVLRFAYQAASALGAAHDKGIVHRDLKPDNLFIVPDPEASDGERLKILDFGIAKLQENSMGSSVKTRTGAVMGTPLYMSPEQCRGLREIDHRSDIYSLGIIMYEMVSGRPPFDSEGFGDLVNMHLNMPVPSIRTAAPDLPASLEALILKSLAKNPDDRFATMAAVREALKGVPGGALSTAASFPDNGTLSLPPGMVPPPSGLSARGQTTSATGAGELTAAPPARRRWAAGVAAIAAIIVAVWGGRAALRSSASKDDAPAAPPAATAPATTSPATTTTTTTPPPPPAATTATLTIVSTPPGARVVDLLDGSVLGTTPFSLSRKPGDVLGMRAELKGFQPSSRELAVTGDQQIAFSLSPRPDKPDEPRPPRHKKTRAEEEPAKL